MKLNDKIMLAGNVGYLGYRYLRNRYSKQIGRAATAGKVYAAYRGGKRSAIPEMKKNNNYLPSPVISPRMPAISLKRKNSTSVPSLKRRKIAKKYKKTVRRSGKMAMRKGKKYGRKNKITKGSPESLFLKKGYVVVQEDSGVATDGQCAWFGHGTAPGERMLETFSSALLKSLFAKAGIYIRDGSDLLDSTGLTQITLEYTDAQSGINGTYVDVLTAVTTFTVEANNIYARFRSLDLSTDEDWVWTQMTLSRTDIGLVLAKISLRDIKVHYSCVSSLKYQNRSYTNDAIEADESALNVDRIPLIGKKYVTKGPFFEYVGNLTSPGTGGLNIANNMPFSIDTRKGRIVKQAGNGDGRLKEPLDAKVFKRTKAFGVKAAPGNVATDIIRTDTSMTLVKFLFHTKQVSSAPSGAYAERFQTKGDLGESHMFALEKALHVTGDLVQVNYEINQKHMCYVTGYEKQYTVAEFVSYGVEGSLPIA